MENNKGSGKWVVINKTQQSVVGEIGRAETDNNNEELNAIVGVLDFQQKQINRQNNKTRLCDLQ